MPKHENWGTRHPKTAAMIALAIIVGFAVLFFMAQARYDARMNEQAQQGACYGSNITQSCLDQLNSQVHNSEAAWCEQHPFDDGCKYSANPDPSQYNNP